MHLTNVQDALNLQKYTQFNDLKSPEGKRAPLLQTVNCSQHKTTQLDSSESEALHL